jgi:hypothetical protein
VDYSIEGAQTPLIELRVKLKIGDHNTATQAEVKDICDIKKYSEKICQFMEFSLKKI